MTITLRNPGGARLALLRRFKSDMDWFQAFLDQLIVAQAKINSADFAIIVKKATDRYEVDRTQMANQFGLNKGTLSRWSNGKNAPKPFARPVVVTWIRDQVQKRVTELEQELLLAEQEEETAEAEELVVDCIDGPDQVAIQSDEPVG